MFTFEDLADIEKTVQPLLEEWSQLKHVTLEFEDRDRVVLQRSDDGEGTETCFGVTYVDGAAPDPSARANPDACSDVKCDCI